MHTKFNRSQWGLILFVSLGSITYGYCSSIISTTLGQPSFIEYFNLANSDNSANIQGAINGAYYAGGLIGCLSVSETAEIFGRRMALFIGGLFSLGGGAIMTGSVHNAMFIVARAVTGLGIGMLVTLVPLYQSELAPPQIRGLLVGTHGAMLCVGYSVASWLGVGFYFVDAGGAQWRIPLAIQCVAPLLLCAGVLQIPESPRYLIRKDRMAEALHTFKSVWGVVDGTEQARQAEQEFLLLHAQIVHERDMATSFKDLITHASLRKRCIVGFLTCFAAQGTATMVIDNYGPMLYASFGYGSVQQLCLQAGWITICPFGNIFNALVVDRIGRVRMLMAGFFGTVVCLIGECTTVAIFDRTGSKSMAGAAVFFLFFHLVCFSSTIDATTYIYSSEIFPPPVRAKGISVSVSGLFVATIIFLQSAPTAFNSIGWKYYIVFVVVTTVMFFVAWFFFPETKGVPLEEIAVIFGDTVEHQVSQGLQIEKVGSDEEQSSEEREII